MVADLDGDRLARALLGQGQPWTRVQVVPSTGSTNADVADAVRAGAAEGLVLVANHQRAGRGRLGRTWETPAGSGLAVSVLLRPDAVAAARWPWLPLLTGVALAEGLRRSAGVAAELKWPNDVLVAGRKLAGVLVERVDGPGGPAAVVGFGVNVGLAVADLPAPQATSLAILEAPTLDRGELLTAVLIELGERYLAWRAAGAATEPLRETYVGRCATLGQPVSVQLPDGSTLRGQATGIDGSGRLLVSTRTGVQAVGAGDVLHLLPGP